MDLAPFKNASLRERVLLSNCENSQISDMGRKKMHGVYFWFQYCGSSHLIDISPANTRKLWSEIWNYTKEDWWRCTNKDIIDSEWVSFCSAYVRCKIRGPINWRWCTFLHPIRGICPHHCYLLVQLDLVEMAFCLSLDEMAERTACSYVHHWQHNGPICQHLQFC